MGKTARKPRSSARRRSRDKILYVRGGNLSAEQKRKYDKLREMLRHWESEDAKMSPEELQQAESDWEALTRSMNEPRIGYRLIYPD